MGILHPMRKLIIFISLFSVLSFAQKETTITASGGSPIPIAYDSSDSQSAAHSTRAAQHLAIQNKTAVDLAYAMGESDTAPSVDAGICQAGAACVKDSFTMGNNSVVYIRSNTGGTITAEDVIIETW